MDEKTKWLKFVWPEREILVPWIQTKSWEYPEKDKKLIVKKWESFLVTNKVANNLFSLYRWRFIEDFSIKTIREKQWNNWQNSYIKYIFVSIIIWLVLRFIGYWFTFYQEYKKDKDEFISNYEELTQILIPYIQIYWCTKIPIEKDDEVTRQNFINKTDRLKYITIELKNGYKKIDDESDNFPLLLDKLVISSTLNTCQDFLQRKKELDDVYNKIIN